MARASPKTVRFTQVVKRSGQPRVHTLWLPPEKDPELQRAKKTHRVMTIEPGAGGGKTDVGTVGFRADAGKRAQFLIFPKSVKPFDGARVIGIKFDLVAQPELASVDVLKSAAAARPRGGKARRISPAQPVVPMPVRAEAGADDATAEPEVIPFEAARAEASEARRAADVEKPRPPERSAPRARTKRKAAHTAERPEASAAERALVREVRAAMRELQRGKSVAAYQRLERAVSGHNG